MIKTMKVAAIAMFALAAAPAAAQDGAAPLRSTFGHEITRNVPPAGATDAQKALIADVALLNEAARGSYEPDATRYSAMADYARWLLAAQGICSHEKGDSLVWGGECSDDQKVSPLAGHEF